MCSSDLLTDRIRKREISSEEMVVLQERVVAMYDNPASEEVKKWTLHEKLEALGSYFVATTITPVWSPHARYICSCKEGMRNYICAHTAVLVLMLDTSIKMPVELDTRSVRLREDRRSKHGKKRARRFIPATEPDMSSGDTTFASTLSPRGLW